MLIRVNSDSERKRRVSSENGEEVGLVDSNPAR